MVLGEAMRPITLVLPHFNNLGMWAEQQRVMADYHADIRAHLHVVLVDDCSPDGLCPTPESVTVKGLASLRIYGLLEKKRWNWLACRNLGAKVATTDWLLLTDIDHVVPAATLDRLMCGPLRATDAYKFSRVTAACVWPYDAAKQPPYKPHNDTWCLTRSMFFSDRVGGYDERLSGCYGTSGEFTDRVRAATNGIETLADIIVRYPREILADASTSPTVYTRKGDPRNDAELKQRKEARAQIAGWKPLHGLVRSKLVYSSVPLEVAVA
jgi:hypothetical protein